MSSDMPHFEETLRSLPAPSELPITLPTTHLTVARWFSTVVDNGELQPKACKVFKRNLLYFFYGGVFYRTSEMPTRNAAEFPIAFLFEPAILKDFDCYYPFDTGAMAAGLFGDWSNRFNPFEERFKVSGRGDYSTPSLMVHHLYGNNENYLTGDVNHSLSEKPEPLPQLGEFLSADVTSSGADGRQLKIECLIAQSLPLNQDLIWVGYPSSMSDIFARIYEKTKPSVPEPFPYPDHKVFRPNEVAAQLQLKAEEVIQRRFISLPKLKERA